jgi:hypothetical protein
VIVTPVRFAELSPAAIAAVGRTSPRRRVGAKRIEINLVDMKVFITTPFDRYELK